MVLFAIGLFSLSSLTAESSDISIILRLMLCGAGFGLFQTPNNSTIISSAPTQRSGGASGMLGMARLLGQTTGTTLVALLFSFVAHDRSTAVCLMVGSGFAVVAAIVSSLRLSQPSTLKKSIPDERGSEYLFLSGIVFMFSSVVWSVRRRTLEYR